MCPDRVYQAAVARSYSTPRAALMAEARLSLDPVLPLALHAANKN
jgi:hypothetical protein